MIDLLTLFALDLEEFTTTSDGCEVDEVTVTAGRPNAPMGQDCTKIYVWADQITDALQTAVQCMVKGRLTIVYEIHTCYEVVDTRDETAAEHAVSADCLYGLMNAVWCGLVAGKSDGSLMDLGSCEDIELGPLEIQPRSGGSVSAMGTVIVPLDC